MTKSELLKKLEPLADNTEILCFGDDFNINWVPVFEGPPTWNIVSKNLKQLFEELNKMNIRWE